MVPGLMIEKVYLQLTCR